MHRDEPLPVTWAAFLLGFVAGFGCGALLVLVMASCR